MEALLLEALPLCGNAFFKLIMWQKLAAGICDNYCT